MSRPKKTPVERALAPVLRLAGKRRQRLADELGLLQGERGRDGRNFRGKARQAKGVEQQRFVGLAQESEDLSRDVGKLLALLDAIGGAS